MAKILIVDDEISLSQMVKMWLEDYGHEVITAYDGKEGIEKVQSEKPDLVVLDIRMPVMNGYEFMRTLGTTLNDLVKPLVPIIVLSVKEKTEEMFKLAGARGYLSKPCDPSVLLAKIEELLSETPSVGELNS